MDAEIFLPVNSGPNYREFFAMLCNMLPLSPGDSRDVRAARERSAMDAVVALHPDDAFEARLAVRAVAVDAQCAASLHAAGLAVNDLMEMRRCRAWAASTARQSDTALRTLLRNQATREKQLAKMHPVAMERPAGGSASPWCPRRSRSRRGAGTGRAGRDRPGATTGLRHAHPGRAVCGDVSRPRPRHPGGGWPAGGLRLRSAWRVAAAGAASWPGCCATPPHSVRRASCTGHACNPRAVGAEWSRSFNTKFAKIRKVRQ